MKHRHHPTRLVARPLPLSLAITAALAAGFAPVAEAADLAWAPIPSVGNRYWNATVGRYSLSNWVDNNQANYYRKLAAGDFLIFDGTAYLDNTNDFTDLWVRGFRFQAFAGAFTLGGNPVTLGHGSESTITNTVSSRQTFNMGITVDGTSLWQGGSGGLTFNGPVTVADANLRLAGGVTINNKEILIPLPGGPPNSYTYLSLDVGLNGNGSLSIENGSVVGLAVGGVGVNSGSKGLVTVTGAGSQWNVGYNAVIGDSGAGTLTVDNGGLVNANNLIVGVLNGSQGTVKVSGTGSQLNVPYSAHVGYAGVGSLAIEGGSVVRSGPTYLGMNSGSNGIVTVTGIGSQWNNSSELRIGLYGTGTMNIESGGLVSSIKGDLGTYSSGNGTVKVSGANSQWNNASELVVGRSGGGSLNIENGGMVSNAYGYVGVSAGSNGAITVTGANSQWNTASKLYIGQDGTGSLSILDSGTVTAPELAIGAKGTVHLDGGNLQIARGSMSPGGIFNWIKGTLGFNGDASIGIGLLANTTTVGSGKTLNVNGKLTSDDSTLNIEGGGVVRSNSGALGFHARSNGTATVTGVNSQWNNASKLTIGQNDANGRHGAGSLSILDSGTVTTQVLAIGAKGTVHLDGGTLQIASGSISPGGIFNWIKGTLGFTGDASIGANLLASTTTVGSGKTLKVNGNLTNDNGNLKITNGGVASSATGAIGDAAGSNGTVTVTGAPSAWRMTEDLNVGYRGTGSLDVLAGGEVSSSYGFIGREGPIGSVATVSGAGSKWVNSLELYVTNGSLVIRDGGFASSRNGIVGGYPGSNGSVTVTGAGSQWNNSAGLYLGKTGTGTLNILDAGRVSAQALTIGSAGTLYLGQGAQLSTVSGTVNNNTVSFDGDSSIKGNFTNNGSVVGSAGTLSFLNDVSGAGRYAGDIQFNAHYSPGNSPAAVAFGGGNVTFGSDSVLDIEVFGATPGTQYDQLLHINTLTFNGTLNLIFSDGYVPAPDSLLSLFDFASFSGSLSADHITVTGYDKSKLDLSRLGIDGSLSVTAVPEPAHWALLLAGLVGLGWQSRRQSRRQRAGQANA